MSYFMVYLILMLDNINITTKVSSILGVIALIIGTLICTAIWAAMLDDEKEVAPLFNSIKKILKYFIPIYAVILFLGIFCPTTKQAATIYLLPKIANNKSLQQLPSQTANLLLLEVKKEIASLKDTATKVVK